MNGKDVALAGLGLLAIASLSIGEFNRQQFEGQITGLEGTIAALEQTVADQRIELIAQDMGNLKLDNEVREQIGMEVINFGMAGYTCKER